MSLLIQLYQIKMNSNDHIRTQISNIKSLADRLGAIWEKVSESNQVVLLCVSCTSKYTQQSQILRALQTSPFGVVTERPLQFEAESAL